MSQALAFVSIIGSLVLVAVTTWYAWQTQQMVREMRAARAATLRPFVRLDLGLVGGVAYLKVENVGVGPATDIDVTLTVDTDEKQLESHHWRRALLRSGESQTLLVPGGQSGTLMDLSELKAIGARARMSGTCRDLDGHTHVVNQDLSFVELGERSPEGSWEGVDDRVPKNIEKIAKAIDGIHGIIKGQDNPWRGV